MILIMMMTMINNELKGAFKNYIIIYSIIIYTYGKNK